MTDTVNRTNAQVDSTPTPRFPTCADSSRWIDRGFRQSADTPLIPWGASKETADFQTAIFNTTFLGLALCQISCTFEPEYEYPNESTPGLTTVVVRHYPRNATEAFEYLRENLSYELGPADLTYVLEEFYQTPAHTALVWDSPFVRASLYIGELKDVPTAEFRARRKYRPQHELKSVSYFDRKFGPSRS